MAAVFGRCWFYFHSSPDVLCNNNRVGPKYAKHPNLVFGNSRSDQKVVGPFGKKITENAFLPAFVGETDLVRSGLRRCHLHSSAHLLDGQSVSNFLADSSLKCREEAGAAITVPNFYWQ